MGTYYIVVNPTKKQFFDPFRFGEAVKFGGFLRGELSIQVLKLLLADQFRNDGHSFPGAWLGDPVIFAGDDNGLPDPGGVSTGSQNLYHLAGDQYADISYRALAELCSNPRQCQECAAAAAKDDVLLVSLGGVADQYPTLNLRSALEKVFGVPWREAYNEALKRTNLSALPRIDWPL